MPLERTDIDTLVTGKLSALGCTLITMTEAEFVALVPPEEREPGDVPHVLIALKFGPCDSRSIKLEAKAALTMGARLIDAGLALIAEAEKSVQRKDRNIRLEKGNEGPARGKALA